MAAVGDELDLVDIATAARLIGMSERYVARLITQGALALIGTQLRRSEVVAFDEQRRMNVAGLQEITDADESLGLNY